MKPYETIISVDEASLCLICLHHLLVKAMISSHIVTTKGCLDLRDPGGLSNLRLGLLLLVPAKSASGDYGDILGI